MFESDFTYTAADPLIIPLDPPLKTGRGDVLQIVLREPTSAQVWAAEQHLIPKNGNKGTRLYQKALVSKVSGVDETALTELPIGVFMKAARYLQDFIEAGLPGKDSEDESAPLPTTFTILIDPPIRAQTLELSSLRLSEPTLGQMAKAESALGDLSAQRVRAYQEQLVIQASGENGLLIASLPISVLNRAASYVMGFSAAGRLMST